MCPYFPYSFLKQFGLIHDPTPHGISNKNYNSLSDPWGKYGCYLEQHIYHLTELGKGIPVSISQSVNGKWPVLIGSYAFQILTALLKRKLTVPCVAILVTWVS